jgi:hypothetical protein
VYFPYASITPTPRSGTARKVIWNAYSLRKKSAASAIA